MEEKKYIVRIPKIGTWIDCNAFGGIYVDRNYQERKIEEAKEAWKWNITAPLQVESRMVKDELWKEYGRKQPVELEYYYAPNPYYGWKEEQLEIIIEK